MFSLLCFTSAVVSNTQLSFSKHPLLQCLKDHQVVDWDNTSDIYQSSKKNPNNLFRFYKLRAHKLIPNFMINY